MAVAAPDRSAEWAAIGKRTTAYAEAVLRGNLVTGLLVKAAAKRHLDDLEHGQQRGLSFDPVEAGWSIQFFPELLRHYKGEWGPIPGIRPVGMPIELEEWQCFIVGCLFGWKGTDGHRRFRSAFIEIAKKNGKTLMAAGIGLRLAFFDDEPAAEAYSAATKRDQAKLLWNDGRAMVERSPALKRRLKGWEPRATVAQLWDPHTASFFKPLSAEAGGEEGINPSALLIDEIHRHTDRALIDMLEQSTGARRQPLVVKITTAGEPGESVWSEEHGYAERVVTGAVDDDATFVYIANLDPGDDPFDEAVWPKANPNYGVSVKPDEMRQRAKEAAESPARRASFERLRLNLRSGSVHKGMVSVDVWNKNDGAPEPARLARAWAGLDLASTIDLTAFAILAPRGELLDWLAWFWMPEAVYEQRLRKRREPWDVWVRAGLITVTEGNVVDYDAVADDIDTIRKRFDIAEIGYDPWNAAGIVTRLASAGAAMVEVRQGFATMTPAVKELTRRLSEGKVRHGGNPVLRWMNANVAIRTDAAGNVKLDREKSADKIDGIAAGATAMFRLLKADESRRPRPAGQAGAVLEFA